MFLIQSKTATALADAAWKRSLEEGRIQDPAKLADFFLEKVSRTFALNIQILPTRLRSQILLAYLLCRMADTLEDDPSLVPEEKIRLLREFQGLFPMETEWRARMEDFLSRVPETWGRSDRWDHLLVFHARWILPQFIALPDGARKAIANCVREMCEGMIRFTERQSALKDGQALIASVRDLDEYCYFVAGTVGMLLCELFALHSPLISKSKARSLRALSVSFGLGLQLTNILKDIHDDRERNVSFLPLDLLSSHGLSPSDFLSPQNRERAIGVLEILIRKTKAHLADALEYTCILPRMEPRLRLFCLWPLFMATETLVVLAENRFALLGGGDKPEPGLLKISRKSVRAILRRTSVACWSNRLIRGLFEGCMARLDSALAAGVR